MNDYQMKLNRAANKCIDMLDALDIHYGEIKEFVVNYRAKSRWGLCHINDDKSFTIQITNELLKDNVSEKALETTILHELLHTVNGCFNHGIIWQTYANMVNAEYGYNIKRVTSYQEKGFEINPMARERKPKYEITCNACSKKWTYQRASNAVKYVRENNARCVCGSLNNFTLITLR